MKKKTNGNASGLRSKTPCRRTFLQLQARTNQPTATILSSNSQCHRFLLSRPIRPPIMVGRSVPTQANPRMRSSTITVCLSFSLYHCLSLFLHLLSSISGSFTRFRLITVSRRPESLVRLCILSINPRRRRRSPNHTPPLAVVSAPFGHVFQPRSGCQDGRIKR